MKHLFLILLCLFPSVVYATDPVDPNSTGYTWTNCTKSLDAGVTESSGVITRTASSSGYGSAYAQCTQQISYGTGAVAIQIASATDVISFGLTNSGTYNLAPSAISTQSGNTGTSLTGSTFGVYVGGNGSLDFWDQQPTRYFQSSSCSSCSQVNDWIMVYSDEGSIKIYRDRAGVVTLLYAYDHNAVTSAYPLLGQISISTNAAHALVKVLQPKTWGTGTNSYVSTTGTLYAAGTQADPATLAIAMGGRRPVNPGDTVWLMDGIYVGLYNFVAPGISGSYVTVRPLTDSFFPTYAARVDTSAGNSQPDGDTAPGITVSGNYIQIQDLEIFNSNPQRISTVPGSNTPDIPVTGGMTLTGVGAKIINCSVHDNNANGILSFNDTGTLIYGTIIYNNGWNGPDRTHGQGIYTHNPQGVGVKLFSNVISFNPYALPIKTFTQQSDEPIYSEYLDDFSSWNGAISLNSNGQKHDMRVNRAYAYNGGIQFGQGDESNWDVIAQNNVVHGDDPFQVLSWRTVDMQNNYIIQKLCGPQCGIGQVKQVGDGTIATGTRNNNVYWRGLNSGVNQNFARYTLAGALVSYFSFAGWQSNTGYDAASTYYNDANQAIATRPNSTNTPFLFTSVVPNIYRTGAATIRVMNFGAAGTPATTVSINLSTSGLVDGQSYMVVSAQSGALIFSGTYSASVPTFTLPMNTDSAPFSRTNDAGTTPATTAPEFNVFLVVPGAANPSAPDEPTGQTAAWSWLSQGSIANIVLNFVNPTPGASITVEKSSDGGANFTAAGTTAPDATTFTASSLGSSGPWIFRLHSTKTGLSSANVLTSPSIYSTPISCYTSTTCSR